MLNKQLISLVIPCRNEAQGLGALLQKVPGWVDEVVVVDNGSTDNTVIVAKKAGARVLIEKRKDSSGIGYGYALQTGMQVAKGDIIVTMDGDGTYPLSQIKSVTDFMSKKNLDVVLCNRFPLKSGKSSPVLRRLGVWILNTEAQLLFGYKISDILSGMWAIKKTTLNQIELKEGGWNLSPEIKLAVLQSEKLSVGQYHINYFRRDSDCSKQQIWRTGLTHLIYMLSRWSQSNKRLSVGYKLVNKLT